MSDFNSRLKKAREKAGLDQPPSGPAPPISVASYALRVATELIAGIIVGGVVGWWIDHQFKTSPWGLIGFLLLGTAAGMFNLVRAVRRMNAQLGAGSGPADTSPDDEED